MNGFEAAPWPTSLTVISGLATALLFVLRLPDRTVVLSPDDPFTLLHQLWSLVPGLEIAGPA